MEFEMVCDYEDILKKAIVLYNQTYKTNFTLKEMIFDDVDFA